MEYILINDSKLKIILESRELAEWDISADELDYANPAAKRVFEGLLDHAKKELGFDTSGYKVLLQLYPSKDGGCELFVTRLGKDPSAKHSSSEKEQKRSEPRAYSFERLSHLLSVCKRLSVMGYKGDSSAWFDTEDRWFLLLSLPFEPTSDADSLNFISEYGEPESPKALALYLSEYGNEVCKSDAVTMLGKI